VGLIKMANDIPTRNLISWLEGCQFQYGALMGDTPQVLLRYTIEKLRKLEKIEGES
jgi:hypothetical protein